MSRSGSAGSSIRRSIDLLIGQAGAQLLSALTFLILARSLDVVEFGYLAVAYSVGIFLSIVIEFGSTNYSVRELGRHPDGGSFLELVRFRIVISGVGMAIGLIVAVIVTDSRVVVWSILLGLSSAVSRLMGAPIRSALRTRTVGLVAMLEKGTVLLIVIFVVFFERLSIEVFLSGATASALLAFVTFYSLWPKKLRSSLVWERPWRMKVPQRELRHLGTASVAVGLQTLDSAVIGFFAGPQVAGTFAAVGRWTQPLSLLAQSVTQSSYAEMAGSGSDKKARQVLGANLFLILGSALPVLVVAIFAESLVHVLLGSEYSRSAPVLRLLAFAVLFGAINAPLSAYLQARSFESFASTALMVAVPCQLALMGALAALYGAAAAALSVLLTQGMLTLVFVAKTLNTR